MKLKRAVTKFFWKDRKSFTTRGDIYDGFLVLNIPLDRLSLNSELLWLCTMQNQTSRADFPLILHLLFVAHLCIYLKVFILLGSILRHPREQNEQMINYNHSQLQSHLAVWLKSSPTAWGQKIPALSSRMSSSCLDMQAYLSQGVKE